MNPGSDETRDRDREAGFGHRSDGGTTAAGGETTGSGLPASANISVGLDTLLDRIDTPVFVLDAEGNIAHWNRALANLTGEDRQGARTLAAEHDLVGPAFYHDGRRSMTLAEKVLEAPESADREYDVPRVETVDYTLYADRSVMKDADGNDRHIEFSAAPVYEEGTLAGVVEMIQDRTADARRQEEVRALMEELEETMAAIQSGNLGARIEPGATEFLDDELLTVVDALNDMAARLEVTVEDVANETAALGASIDDVAESSRAISDTADEQAQTMKRINGEINTLSATVEEIASTSNEVAETAEEADGLAEDIQATAEGTRDVMAEIADSAAAVAADVETLRERIDQIDEVVEVIHDIAEQTNMLALNASIEAARAGEDGKGFAVVADEVKSLAEESQTRAGEIEDLVKSIKTDAAETVDSLQETTERVENGLDRVEETTDSLQEIVAAVNQTAAGIEQVSDATDDQAASAEEITSMLAEAVDRADEVNTEIETIASTNAEQQAQVERINEVIGRLSGR